MTTRTETTSLHPLAGQVDEYLKRTGMTPSRFGSLAAGDPSLVFELRNGREPRRTLCARIETFMRDHPNGLPAASSRDGRGEAA